MSIPADQSIDTNILREEYARNNYSFGNPNAFVILCFIGSCRIVPILNYFRAYNSMNGNPFELLCFNPVEMWKGPGTDIGEIVTEKFKDFRFGHVDVLICESLITCGSLNTVDSQPLNVFATLGCAPETILRIPNWHGMLFYDADVERYNKEYAALPGSERIAMLRTVTDLYKQKFLKRCALSSYPELVEWVKENWTTTRMGWTSEHPSRNLTWKFFELICRDMGLTITRELAEHSFCAVDTYASSGVAITDIDRDANNWKF